MSNMDNLTANSQNVRSLVCATPSGDPLPPVKGTGKKSTAAIDRAARKGTPKTDKLPVPPPKHPEASAARPKDEAIPPFLDAKKNGLPRGKAAPVVPRVAEAQEKRNATAEAQKEAKKEKSRIRVEKMLAKKSGATKAMPLEGKAALAFIAAGDPPKAPAKAKGTPKPAKATKVAAKAPKRASEPRSGSKTALIGEMLRRPNGCTTAEVLKATGWPSVSMPAQARAVGVKLLKEKIDGVFRYRAG